MLLALSENVFTQTLVTRKQNNHVTSLVVISVIFLIYLYFAGSAWVTLATNDSYSLGALVLAHSLKQTGTVHQLAVLVTPGVTSAMR